MKAVCDVDSAHPSISLIKRIFTLFYLLLPFKEEYLKAFKEIYKTFS